MLLHIDDPEMAYRRSAVDGRISAASPQELVHVCFEQVVAGLATAIRAHENGDNARRSAGLTRAHAGLTALEMGIDRSAPLADALLQLYASAREAILQAVTRFDSATFIRIREDFREIGEAFSRAA